MQANQYYSLWWMGVSIACWIVLICMDLGTAGEAAESLLFAGLLLFFAAMSTGVCAWGYYFKTLKDD